MLDETPKDGASPVADAGLILNLKRHRNLIAERLSRIRHYGGKGYVVIRKNGSCLSGKTGVYEFETAQAWEVPEDTDPKDFGGDAVVTKTEALVAMSKALGKHAVAIDRRLKRMGAV